MTDQSDLGAPLQPLQDSTGFKFSKTINENNNPTEPPSTLNNSIVQLSFDLRGPNRTNYALFSRLATGNLIPTRNAPLD